MNRRIAKKRQRIQLTVIFSISLLGLLVILLMHLFSNNILATEANNNIQIEYISVKVQEDDTLWELATTYNSSEYYTRDEYIEAIIKMNDLKSERLYTGTRITLPKVVSLNR